MGTIYTLTEDNYKEVIARLQKIANRWKLLRKDECYRVSSRTRKENYPKYLKEHESKSWGTNEVYDGEDENGRWKFKQEKVANSYFIWIKQHHFRKDYEENPETFEGKQWLHCKPLLHVNLAASSAICPTIGDRVIINKHGFIIVDDNSYTNGGAPSLTYKYHFIIDRSNKILDLDAEIEQRNKEWAEDAEFFHREFERDLEQGFWDDDDFEEDLD